MIRKSIGGLVLWGFFLWLVVQGCIVLRPARTAAMMSALLTALINACNG